MSNNLNEENMISISSYLQEGQRLIKLSDGTFIPIGLHYVELLPIGSVVAFAGTLPSGFLLCSGGAVSRETYAELFESIGTTYGAGDGTTTFNIPNLVSKFIQGGWSANVGESIAAGLPDITGGSNNRRWILYL